MFRTNTKSVPKTKNMKTIDGKILNWVKFKIG